MVERAYSGLLITFEGIEGAGKTTQIFLLAESLKKEGWEVVHTFEPGATPIGRLIREFLFSHPIPAETETFLFVADRILHWKKVIAPALEEGKIVLCDRFSDSTYAYQGYGTGVSLKLIRELHERTMHFPEPDLTILLDIPVEEAINEGDGRKGSYRIVQPRDRIERRPVEFHRKVRAGYLKLAQM
ncbi:MAG: dTMP kinase, partial [bacterium]